jgi:hypothetical protein
LERASRRCSLYPISSPELTKRGKTVIVLLCGGDKKTQKRDIETAKRTAKEA